MRAVVVVGLIAVAALAGCGGGASAPRDPLERDARTMFGYDSGRPLAARERRLPDAEGLSVTGVTYVGGEGQRVPAVLASPPGAQNQPCVVFMHGYLGSKEDAEPLARPMKRLGVSVFALDAAYQGARSSTEIRRVIRDPVRLVALYRQTVVDMRRALDYLDTRQECDPERLGVVGLSFGGVAGLLTAAVDDRVRSTVAMSISGSFDGLLSSSDLLLSPAEAKDPAVVERARRTLAAIAPVRWAARVAPRPLLLVNGRADPLNPDDVVEPLVRAARRGSAAFVYEGGHNPFGGRSESRAVLERIERFERTTLLDADARADGA